MSGSEPKTRPCFPKTMPRIRRKSSSERDDTSATVSRRVAYWKDSHESAPKRALATRRRGSATNRFMTQEYIRYDSIARRARSRGGAEERLGVREAASHAHALAQGGHGDAARGEGGHQAPATHSRPRGSTNVIISSPMIPPIGGFRNDTRMGKQL